MYASAAEPEAAAAIFVFLLRSMSPLSTLQCAEEIGAHDGAACEVQTHIAALLSGQK